MADVTNLAECRNRKQNVGQAVAGPLEKHEGRGENARPESMRTEREGKECPSLYKGIPTNPLQPLLQEIRIEQAPVFELRVHKPIGKAVTVLPSVLKT
jgi:hypothetical protein